MSDRSNIKILVAEDDPLYGKVYQSKLTREGYNVILVTNGQDAVEQALKEKPSLVLMDIIMPILDGFEALKRIKADPEGKDIKVIIMSNLSQDSDIEKAKGFGAFDYFVKSNISITELVEKISKVVEA